MEVETLTPKFYTVKLEDLDLVPDGSICHGCLSSDRVLSPVTNNIDLFLNLLGGHTLIESELILLCWECTAILRKMQKFRNRVQHAQLTLQQALSQENSYTCLSTLGRIKLEPITDIHNEVSPHTQYSTLNQEPLGLSNDIENDQKSPLSFTNDDFDIEDESELEVKEIKVDVTDRYDIAIAVPEKEVKIETDLLKQPIEIPLLNFLQNKCEEKRKKETSNFRRSDLMIKYKNPNVDVDNHEKCFFKDVLSIKEIEDMGKPAIHKSGKVKKNNKLVCMSCMKLFHQKLDLNRHNTFCHILKESEGPFTCLECKGNYPDRHSLETHWREHNSIDRCKECGWYTSKPWTTTMRQHAETHKFLRHCRLCPGLVLRSFHDFSLHFKAIHKQSICDHCGKQTTTKHLMFKHIRKCHLPAECKPCNTKFKNYYRLVVHNNHFHPKKVDKTTKELAYCVECDKQYPSEARYKMHLATSVVHNTKYRRSKKVPCPDCGKIFTRTAYMNNHYKLVHQKVTQHYCALCDKYLLSAWAKKKHDHGVHLKIREPKTKICDICHRGFSSNTLLTRHRRTHTGERPYLCPHCPAAFTQRTPLVSHARTQHHAKL